MEKQGKLMTTLLMSIVLSLGIIGLANATSFQSTVNAKLTLTTPSIIINCPVFIQGQSTTCTANVGNSATGTLKFNSSSSGGSFNPISGSCTLVSGTCSIGYTDNTIGTPKITVAYSGDGLNAKGSNSILTTVIAATCGLNLGSNSIDISSGNIASTSVKNGGNVNTSVQISGTNWINTSNSVTFGVGFTLWGLTSPPSTALSNTPVSVTSKLTPSSSLPVFFSATVPTGTLAAVYSQTITFASGC